MNGLEPIELIHDGTELRGFVAKPGGDGPFPTVLVMHSALGLHHQVEGTARKLADLGYLAVATDMYGTAADLSTEESLGASFQGLMEAPERLRSRAVAWLHAVAARSDVDAGRIAAIGYCFGGTCVLELARSGAEFKAAVSYHGILTTQRPAQSGAVRPHVAAYCGAKDRYAPLEHIAALRQELTDAGASFTITVFGDAEHGFTDPDAARGGRPGISYDAIADEVSWAGTLALLEVLLKK